MPRKRHIVVVTGTRAEFGLLAPVMRAIRNHPRLRLSIIATGTHLTTGTVADILAAGFKIAAKVPMQRRGVTGHPADVAALGRGIVGLGKVFEKLRPDVVLVLGDRIEAFAAATAANVGGRYVAHIHGGDRAEGVADEAMRHAISKLSHLHFPATIQSRERLIRMGEQPAKVFMVGSPAIDGLKSIKPASIRGLHGILLQHPIGASDATEESWMSETISATISELRGHFLPIAPNSDPGSDGIRCAMRSVWKRNSGIDRVHLPRAEFLTWLKASSVIIGNSSAGLIEAAALGIPCVNIGPRQNGREKPANVVDCDYGQANVASAIRRALKLDLRKRKHPYGDGRSGQRIAQLLAKPSLTKGPLRKLNSY